jgi:hypothetical protein
MDTFSFHDGIVVLLMSLVDGTRSHGRAAGKGGREASHLYTASNIHCLLAEAIESSAEANTSSYAHLR